VGTDFRDRRFWTGAQAHAFESLMGGRRGADNLVVQSWDVAGIQGLNPSSTLTARRRISIRMALAPS
jgi:hypothetical protein